MCKVLLSVRNLGILGSWLGNWFVNRSVTQLETKEVDTWSLEKAALIKVDIRSFSPRVYLDTN